jgi:two-component sensor histidine kinase
VLRWKEQGSPTTTAPAHVGFGTRMMWRMVRDQLNGEMRLDWRAEGLKCEIEFPIDVKWLEQT